MDVKNTLARGWLVKLRHPDAISVELALQSPRNARGCAEQRPGQFIGQIIDVFVMLDGNDKRVPFGQLLQAHKGHHGFVAIDDGSGKLARDNFAKNTIFHLDSFYICWCPRPEPARARAPPYDDPFGMETSKA